MGRISDASTAATQNISVDLIRTVAIVLVIFLHATADLTVPQMDQFEIVRWTVNDVYQSIARVCVPLFVMLSGALLLQPHKHDTLSDFFKKRWARIGLPWIFWGAAYFVWNFLVLQTPFTFNAVAMGIVTGPYYNFWYLYMLVGLYLLTPVLRIILPKINRDLVKRYLGAWFFASAILPFTLVFTTYTPFSNLATSASWVAYLLFGLAGYFVLGTFLIRVKIRRLILVILTVLGITLTAIGIYILQSPIGGNREVYAFTVYFGPWTVLTAVSLFMLLNTINIPTKAAAPSKGAKLLSLISQNTLPIALFHLMVLESLQRGFLGFAINGNTVNTIVGVPLITAITLFASLAIILLLKKVPYLKRLIG